MKTYGYLFDTGNYLGKEYRNKLEKYRIDEMRIDRKKYERDRPAWKSLLRDLKKGDTLIIMSLGNVIRNTNLLPLFLTLCQKKAIRLVSIYDQFDSHDQYFPAPSTDRWIAIIGSLTKSVSDNHHINDDEFVPKTEIPDRSKQRKKRENVKLVINLYTSGTPMNEILSLTGIKSRSSIYRILHQYGIPVQNRRERADRDQIVKDLYDSGHSIHQIQALVGYHQPSSVYVALRRMGVYSPTPKKKKDE